MKLCNILLLLKKSFLTLIIKVKEIKIILNPKELIILKYYDDFRFNCFI